LLQYRVVAVSFLARIYSVPAFLSTAWLRGGESP